MENDPGSLAMENKRLREDVNKFAMLVRYMIAEHNGPLKFKHAQLERLAQGGPQRIKLADDGQHVVAWLE